MKKLRGVKLAIFDHSGVLSDDRLPVYEANTLLLKLYGAEKISFEDWLRASKASAGDLVKAFCPDVSVDEVNELYRQVYGTITSRTSNPIRPVMYKAVPDFLSTLKSGHRMSLGVVSTHPQHNLERELAGYDIGHFFDVISGDPSPKGERLKKLCDHFKLTPNKAFFVEDMVWGLRAAREAGLNCFGVTTGYHSRERLEAENPTAVVDSLTEILDYV